MNNQEFALEILKIVIPVLTAFLSFYLGRISSTKTTTKEILKERLDKFYLPFIKYLSKELANANDFYDYAEIMNEFIDLLADNYRYVNTETQLLILELIGNIRADNHEQWSDGFSKITQNVFAEYKQLCKQLKYPTPALPTFLPLTLKRQDLKGQAEEIIAAIEHNSNQ